MPWCSLAAARLTQGHGGFREFARSFPGAFQKLLEAGKLPKSGPKRLPARIWPKTGRFPIVPEGGFNCGPEAAKLPPPTQTLTWKRRHFTLLALPGTCANNERSFLYYRSLYLRVWLRQKPTVTWTVGCRQTDGRPSPLRKPYLLEKATFYICQ